jgi:pyruvate formate lyase activating enzyme
MNGLILDIQRFSLHDGPGIRSVIFLKGCYLRCIWCCNPESQEEPPQLGFEESKCLQCYACINLCEYRALYKENQRLQVNFNKCIACGNCVKECPSNALKIFGEKNTVEEVIKEIEKDRPYYEQSGGGLTVSGGEPLWQFEFLLEILDRVRSCAI